MGLCRFLPTPSDRMAILWSLLTIEDSIVLEYGPAGTTHYSMGLFGKLNVDQQNHLFTTHMTEDDVIMGDVTRLEKAIKELDEAYKPKVIFVVASSVSAVIGTDIIGVCRCVEDEINATLIALEQGGFRGDYSIGVCETYKLLVHELVERPQAKKKKSYNIIGASMGSYRIESDVNEIKRLIKTSFDFDLHTSLCTKSSVDDIKTMSEVAINLVISYEGIESAKLLEKEFGIPYVYGCPYGYNNTFKWLEEISGVINEPVNPQVKEELYEKISEISQYRMYIAMLKEEMPTAFIYADYDKVISLSEYLDELCIKTPYKICKHTLKNIDDVSDDVQYLPLEKDRIELLKSLNHTLVFADDVSNSLVSENNTTVRFSTPFIKGSVISNHMPFVGIRGADAIRECFEEYLSDLK